MSKKKFKSIIKFDSVEAPEKLDIKLSEGMLKFDAKQPKYNHLGWLMVDAVIAKVGIVSRFQDGIQRHEYISEEELFKQDSLDTLLALDIEQHHNSGINSGVIFGTPKKEKNQQGTYLVVPLAIKPKNVIKDVLNNITSEVSPEYESNDIPVTGKKFDGKDYNFEQKNRVYLKMALVRNGTARGGRDVRVKLDSTDGTEKYLNYKEELPELQVNIKKETVRKMGEVDIDGTKIEVTEATGASLINSKLKMDSQTIIDLKTQLATEKTNNEALTADKVLLEGKVTKFDSVDYKNSIIQEAKDRLKLESEVIPVIGDNVKLDGLSDTELRKQALIKIDSTIKFDGLDDKEIKGQYEATMRFQNNNPDADKNKLDSIAYSYDQSRQVGAGARQQAGASAEKIIVNSLFNDLAGKKA